jgi:hypothetical protein
MSVPNIEELDSLSREALCGRYEELYGRPVPKGMSRPLILRLVAYRIQEIAAGGPNIALKRRLAKLAAEFDTSGSITVESRPTIKAGTRLIREWRGETHAVTVTDEGFLYREKPYRSLSVIAREITGTRWSGPAFFGLKGRSTASRGSKRALAEMLGD